MSSPGLSWDAMLKMNKINLERQINTVFNPKITFLAAVTLNKR